jgi:hypothetical protein
VTLLLDIGHQLAPDLHRAGVVPDVAHWQTVRAPLVHRLVATRYLQADVARWAVDVWGQVLGVAPQPSPPMPAPSVHSQTHTGAVGSAGRVTNTNTGAGPRTTPAPAVPRAVPRATTRAASSGVGGRGGNVRGATGAPVTRAAAAWGTAGPLWSPVERKAALVFGIVVFTLALSLWRALEARPPYATATPASAATTTAMTALPAGRDNDVPAVDTATFSSLVAAVDTVPGTSEPPVRSVRAVGVGGRYRVASRVRDVGGSPSCDAVARALGAGRKTDEVVRHVPGAAAFVLVTRRVSGTLADDGGFVAEPRTGVTNNISWKFRMRGRFLPDGFFGESETVTEAILGWGKTQTCVVTALLDGRRLPE